jgi:16S rRNA (guanine1207-N2)-methyltransferase
VLGGRRPERVPGLVPTLSGWRETFPLSLPGLDRSWVSYPGVFAHGRLDEGSALLAGALPVLPVGARALDFGCGSGVLGALLLARQPGCTVDFLDTDSVALEAVRENVPGERLILSGGLGALAEERYQLIVSNPPIHAGKAETLDVLQALVAGAGGHLAADGELWLVAQRRLPVRQLLERSFRTAAIVADDGRLFRVWRATRQPKGSGLTPGAPSDPPGRP